MTISIYVPLTAIAVTSILLFTSFQEVKSSPAPRGGGGRGGGGGFRGGGGSRGGGGKSRYSGGGYSSKTYTSKSSGKQFSQNKWQGALAFGAGAYVGHQVSWRVRGKLSRIYL